MTWDREECLKRLPFMLEIANGRKLLMTNGILTKVTEENKKDICPYFSSFTDDKCNTYATMKDSVWLVDYLEIIRFNHSVVEFAGQYRIVTPDMDVSGYNDMPTGTPDTCGHECCWCDKNKQEEQGDWVVRDKEPL